MKNYEFIGISDTSNGILDLSRNFEKICTACEDIFLQKSNLYTINPIFTFSIVFIIFINFRRPEITFYFSSQKSVKLRLKQGFCDRERDLMIFSKPIRIISILNLTRQ